METLTYRTVTDRYETPRNYATGLLEVFPAGTRTAHPVAIDHDAAYLYYWDDDLPNATEALYVIAGRAWYVAAWGDTVHAVTMPDGRVRADVRRLILHPVPDDAGNYFRRPPRAYILSTTRHDQEV